MIGFKTSLDVASLERAMKDAEADTMALARGAMEVVGFESVAYLRSLTSETRPPVFSGQGLRRAHPGHWADVTGQLALSYGFNVGAAPNRVRLELFNTAEYAVYVEAFEGYWVLSGFTDAESPLWGIMHRAARALGFQVA